MFWMLRDVLRRIVRYALVYLHRLRPPHPLCDLAQGAPILCMQVPEPIQSPLGELGALRCRRGFGGQAGHLGLRSAQLLLMRRGLSRHAGAKSALALTGAHGLGGDELHVGHGNLGGVRGAAQLHLFELGVVDPFLHLIVRLLDPTEL
jgi:hypothetical protein